MPPGAIPPKVGGKGPQPPAPQPPLPTFTPGKISTTLRPPPKPPKPALRGPIEPPHPVLQRAGVNRGIQHFNNQVAQVAQAHQKAYGTLPLPGLTLDVVRSGVDPHQYPRLFTVPRDPNVARAQGTLQQHQQAEPHNYFITRFDGIQQPNNPLLPSLLAPRRQAPGVVPGSAGAQAAAPPPGISTLVKKYPMVELGALPIPHMGDVMAAIRFLNAPAGPSINPSSGGLTTATGLKFTDPSEKVIQAAQNRGATSLKQAQTDLNKEMGTNLPVTGVFNTDWTTALHNWMRSESYFKKEIAFQAQQAGFGNDVQAYRKAWLSKQKLLRHGLEGQFLAAMPLGLFGHGGFWQALASIPGYLKGSSNNPINIGLHGLTRTAGLGLDTIGGTVNQFKADAAAGTAFAAYMSGEGGKHHTYEQALAAARKQLHANPSWLRVFAFGRLPVHEKGWLAKVDLITNVAGDLILLRKANFTGEEVATGDMAGALKSERIQAASHWAFNDLQIHGIDGIGRASSRLGSATGARALVARAAKLVKNGDMTEEQFRQHVAELYATGHTLVNGKDVSGSVLEELRTNKLPTPGKAGTNWIKFKQNIRQQLDQFDANAHDAISNRAHAVGQLLRNSVAHAAPEGARLHYFQEILPERVFNFVRKYDLGDDALANKLESKIVHYQGTQNVVAIKGIENKLRQLWHERYPSKSPPSDEPFQALISSELPTYFHFPGGGTDAAAVDGAWNEAIGFAKKVNATLNKVAKIHGRIILSGANLLTGLGGFSLFWKHTVGDGLRAIVGGVLAGLNPDTRKALAEIEQLAKSDPAVAREYGGVLDMLRTSEANWALGKDGSHTFSEDFATGDVLTKQNFLKAAAGYLRRHAEATELKGYQDGNLVDVILNNREARAAWKSMRKKLGEDYTAEMHAQNVTDEYQNITNALESAQKTWDDVLETISKNRGHEADPALAKFIKENELNFNVRGGLVEKVNRFDSLSQRWVGNVIMRPNKFWRSQLAKATIAKFYRSLKASGVDDKTALSIASDTAAKIVKYHMLDFANRLQVEQDLRWISYFATKHRLYFKWVLSTFARHPGYAAVVSDFQHALNSQGGVTLPFKVLGGSWQIPLERLLWVPGREYDETSPLGMAVLDFIKSGGNLDQIVKSAVGTQGNVITRSDTASVLGVKLMKIESGNAPSTYGYATAGLDKRTADYIKRGINEYQLEYFKTHGHYAPESQVVKIVLLHQLGQEYWRANLPLPVVPYQPTTEQDKTLAEFMTLITPKARAKFLQDHPGFSDTFGVYENPTKYLHNEQFFLRWSKAIDAFRAGRAQLFQQAEKLGHWTVEMEKDRRELSAALERTRNTLLTEDAQQSGIDTHGLVPNGSSVPFGPWGKLVNNDPQFDPTHVLSQMFPKLSKDTLGNVIGPLQRQMQQELSLLNDPTYVKQSGYSPSEITTRRSELLTALQVFKSYPSDALGKIQDQYQNKVNSYWAEYNRKYNETQSAPSSQRTTLDASFRAWRDSQDHPVTIGGVTFPSPIRMEWAMMDPRTRQQRLAYLAGKPAEDLADYELTLLGVNHPPNVSAAFAAIDAAKQEYRQKYPGQRLTSQQIRAVAKQVDKQPGYHGFYAYFVNTVTAPRIRQFEQTNIYRGLPADVRAGFNEIGQAAIKITQDAAKGNKTYYEQAWRTAVQQQIQPWLNEAQNKQLREFIDQMGPNFLDDLVTSSSS